MGVANEEADRKLIKSIIKDLEVLEIFKKFFNFDAYYVKNLNSDFLEIIAKEDEEANIDRKAISFIDSDSRKLLEEWLENKNLRIAEYGSATTISISPTDEPMVVEVKTPDEFIIYNEENKNDK